MRRCDAHDAPAPAREGGEADPEEGLAAVPHAVRVHLRAEELSGRLAMVRIRAVRKRRRARVGVGRERPLGAPAGCGCLEGWRGSG